MRGLCELPGRGLPAIGAGVECGRSPSGTEAALIPHQWYVVLSSAQVRRRPVGVTRLGERLVFWRDAEGRVVCLRDHCVHRGAQLSAGSVTEDGYLACPFHGFRYDASGRVTLIPAHGRAAAVPERFRGKSYPTHEAHGFIWIWWGEAGPQGPPRFFDDLADGLVYGVANDAWATRGAIGDGRGR